MHPFFKKEKTKKIDTHAHIHTQKKKKKKTLVITCSTNRRATSSTGPPAGGASLRITSSPLRRTTSQYHVVEIFFMDVANGQNQHFLSLSFFNILKYNAVFQTSHKDVIRHQPNWVQNKFGCMRWEEPENDFVHYCINTQGGGSSLRAPGWGYRCAS